VAVPVHDAEVVLRVGVPLLGCQAIPPNRLGLVSRDTSTMLVHEPEAALRGGVSLGGGEAIQPDRLDIVLRDILTRPVLIREGSLCFRVACISQRMQFVERLSRVEAYAGKERTDTNQDGGQGEDTYTVNPSCQSLQKPQRRPHDRKVCILPLGASGGVGCWPVNRSRPPRHRPIRRG